MSFVEIFHLDMLPDGHLICQYRFGTSVPQHYPNFGFYFAKVIPRDLASKSKDNAELCENLGLIESWVLRGTSFRIFEGVRRPIFGWSTIGNHFMVQHSLKRSASQAAEIPWPPQRR